MDGLISVVDWVTIIITCCFIALDIVSGIIKAFVQHDIRSGKMWLGVMKKSAYIIVIVLAILCDWGQLYLDLGYTVPLLMAACVIIILTEIASILENACCINPELTKLPFFKLFNVNHEEGKDA